RRRHREVAPQPAARPAVVGRRDDGGHVGDPLQAAQDHAEAGSSAQADDTGAAAAMVHGRGFGRPIGDLRHPVRLAAARGAGAVTAAAAAHQPWRRADVSMLGPPRQSAPRMSSTVVPGTIGPLATMWRATTLPPQRGAGMRARRPSPVYGPPRRDN